MINDDIKMILKTHEFYIGAIEEIFAGRLTEKEFYESPGMKRVFKNISKLESLAGKADFLRKVREHMKP